MSKESADSIQGYILAQTAAGEVADFTLRSGYSDAGKPAIKAEFLRQLLLGKIEGATILRPGVRIIGVMVEGAFDLRDCAGAGLPALCLEHCDFSDQINVSNSRLARLSLSHSRIRALIGVGLSVDDHVDFSGVAPIPAPDPFAFVDLRSCRVSGSVIGSGATLKVLRAAATAYVTQFALDLSHSVISGSVFADAGFTAEGGTSLVSAQIGGLVVGTKGSFTSGSRGGQALTANLARIGGAVLLNESRASAGSLNFDDASLEGSLDCSDARYEHRGYTTLSLRRASIKGSVYLTRASLDGAMEAGDARVGGGLMLDIGFSANGSVNIDGATIEGSFDCSRACFMNPGSTALSAFDARIGRSVKLVQTQSKGGVSFQNATVGSAVEVLFTAISDPKLYALNLQAVRIGGDLVACRNEIKGAVTLSGAKIGRLYDDAASAWSGASGIDLNDLDYAVLSANPFFFIDEMPLPVSAGAPNKNSKSKIWRIRREWLQRNTGAFGKSKGPFSNQPWRQCVEALARGGHYADARRLAQEEQREVNRRREWWKKPFVFLFAELAFGYGLSVTRATLTSLLFWLAGWAGTGLMLQRGVLVEMREGQGVIVCTAVDPAIYALDVAIPVLDLKEESVCRPGRLSGFASVKSHLAVGPLLIDEIRLWRWIKALYAIAGSIIIGLTILTYSGVFKPKSAS